MDTLTKASKTQGRLLTAVLKDDKHVVFEVTTVCVICYREIRSLCQPNWLQMYQPSSTVVSRIRAFLKKQKNL